MNRSGMNITPDWLLFTSRVKRISASFSIFPFIVVKLSINYMALFTIGG